MEFIHDAIFRASSLETAVNAGMAGYPESFAIGGILNIDAGYVCGMTCKTMENIVDKVVTVPHQKTLYQLLILDYVDSHIDKGPIFVAIFPAMVIPESIEET